MTIFQDARVLVMIADYAGVDGSGKLNAIGAGFNLTQIDPQTGMSPPQFLVVVVDVPVRHVGSEYPVVVELRRDDTNEVVSVPGPTGPQALRIQQMARVDHPPLPQGVQRPPALSSRHQMVMSFATGIPLQAGASYRWRVEIEGQSRPQWNAVFHVLAPVPGPLFGGPSAPPDPEMPPLAQNEEDDTEPPQAGTERDD